MEEMLTYEELNMEDTEVNEEIVEPKNSGNGIVGAIVGGTLVAVTAGAGLLWHKTKDKREARKIEKLRKKGYTIIEPVVDDTEVVVEADFTEDEAE